MPLYTRSLANGNLTKSTIRLEVRDLMYFVILKNFSRVFKTDKEIAVMRRVCDISVEAHKKVLQS